MCLAISTIPIGIIGGIEGFQSSLVLIGLIFLVTFVVSIMISYLITRPLEKLTDNIIQISKGKLDVELASSEIHEINKLTDSLNRIMASLKLAIHKVGVKKGEIFEDNVTNIEGKTTKHDDLFDTISGWAWETDKKGKYTYCSENILKFLGYNPKEIVGKYFSEIFSNENEKETKQIFKNAINNKVNISNLETHFIHKNGEKIYVRTNGMPILDESGNLIGYRGINTDITAEKDAENKIKELNTKVSDLKTEINEIITERKNEKEETPVESPVKVPVEEPSKKEDEVLDEHKIDYVFIFDENANILACTDSMYKKLGYSKEEMLSLTINDFDALETQDEIKEKIDKAKQNGKFSFKTIHKRKDGSTFLVYENFQYLKDKNAYRCIVKEDFSAKKSS
jgi:PAS domain S-box-containing protein